MMAQPSPALGHPGSGPVGSGDSRVLPGLGSRVRSQGPVRDEPSCFPPATVDCKMLRSQAGARGPVSTTGSAGPLPACRSPSPSTPHLFFLVTLSTSSLPPPDTLCTSLPFSHCFCPHLSPLPSLSLPCHSGHPPALSPPPGPCAVSPVLRDGAAAGVRALLGCCCLGHSSVAGPLPRASRAHRVAVHHAQARLDRLLPHLSRWWKGRSTEQRGLLACVGPCTWQGARSFC